MDIYARLIIKHFLQLWKLLDYKNSSATKPVYDWLNVKIYNRIKMLRVKYMGISLYLNHF